MSTPEYNRLAYRLALLRYAQKCLRENLLSDLSEPLLCEDVRYSDREVPPDAVLDLLQEMQNAETTTAGLLATFTLTRNASPFVPTHDKILEAPKPQKPESPVEPERPRTVRRGSTRKA